MGMVAIFRVSCCKKEIVFGRFPGAQGETINTITKCPHGCKPLSRGRETPMEFVELRVDSLIPKELLATWKHGKTGDLWHKYDREWKRRKAAAEQGYPVETNKKRGKK